MSKINEEVDHMVSTKNCSNEFWKYIGCILLTVLMGIKEKNFGRALPEEKFGMRHV